jgi:hypothetical protein
VIFTTVRRMTLIKWNLDDTYHRNKKLIGQKQKRNPSQMSPVD